MYVYERLVSLVKLNPEEMKERATAGFETWPSSMKSTLHTTGKRPNSVQSHISTGPHHIPLPEALRKQAEGKHKEDADSGSYIL